MENQTDFEVESSLDQLKVLWARLNNFSIVYQLGIVIFIIFFFLFLKGVFWGSNENAVVEEKIPYISSPSSMSTDLVVNDEMLIHVTGAVKSPGVYSLSAGDRVADAIEKAGGGTAESDLSDINLASQLNDGSQIRIPKLGEEISVPYIVESQSSDSQQATKININTANLDQLEEIPGVGPSLANKIFSYREANGKFQSIEDLLLVSGIGDAKLEGMRDFLVL